MIYQNIISEVKNRVHYISLNRPDKRNAFSPDLVSELKDVLRFSEQQPEIKAIVIRAEGPAFCAGADLAYLQQLQNNSYDENVADSNHLRELFELIYRHPKIIIAQVEGPALAGGCGLASVCDFTIATAEATFGYTEARIGFIPAMVMVFLIRKIGEGAARELLLSGKIISAKEALDLRLINSLVPANEINAYVQQYAELLSTSVSGRSVQLIKEMFWNLSSLNYEEALNYTAAMNAEARAGDDCKKGIAAFLNKSKLSW